jgi:phosphatidylglycerol---prolipoprotein diacylglyceryl transferase
MFIYPHINPIAFQLGPIKVHWYGLMYLVGFIAAWILLSYRAKHMAYHAWAKERIGDLLFYTAIGGVVGGRVGYMLVYATPELLAHPLQLFKVWDGGMSFHGGLVGVGLAMYLYSRKIKMSFFKVTDFLGPAIPIGLGAGRIGNFINGELWGRVTHVPWAMIYPQVGPQPRHPSEIYEFLLEGVLLFIILWFYSRKPRPRMAVTGLFLLGYGVFRTFCEFFRQPDQQLGFIAWGWLTMGMLLSFPMIVFGIIFLVVAYKRKHVSEEAKS